MDSTDSYNERPVLRRLIDRLLPKKSPQPENGERTRPDQLAGTKRYTESMTMERVNEGIQLLQRYINDKAIHDMRVVEDEQWWRLHSWDVTGHARNPGDPEPNSGYTVNAIMNKHADAMDNYPVPTIRPRERQDEQAASMLSAVVPVILQRNGYEETYSTAWWNKLKYGTAITGVFWDAQKENGLGDISIKCVDPLNLFWEPGVTDIQNSRNVFFVDLVDWKIVREQWPEKAELIEPSRPALPKRYVHNYDEMISEKTLLIDWYYKTYNGGKPILHFAKLAGDVVLYCSEDDPQYKERGFYDHGMYPFVFDIQFPLEDTPIGTGFIDLCKPAQRYVDKLDQAILKYSIAAARPRWFVREDTLVNIPQYADVNNDFVTYQGNGSPEESLRQIQMNPLPGIYAEIRQLKVEELKEVAGNRDFNQGSIAGGVTAASAIAALQESGNKLSRDFIAASRRAYVRLVLLVIELIRQFYTEERTFRITGDNGKTEYMSVGSSMIAPRETMMATGPMEYVPIFDIEVGSEKSNPFSTITQNERAIQMYQMGMFDPARADQATAAIELMDFDGKMQTLDRVRKGRTMFEQLKTIQELTPIIMQMATDIDAEQGSDIAARLGSALESAGLQVGMPDMGAPQTQSVQQQNAQNGARKAPAPSDTPRTPNTASDGRFRVARAASRV